MSSPNMENDLNWRSLTHGKGRFADTRLYWILLQCAGLIFIVDGAYLISYSVTFDSDFFKLKLKSETFINHEQIVEITPIYSVANKY